MNATKKIISAILIISMLMCGFAVNAFAVISDGSGAVIDSDYGDVSFNVSYPEIGKKMKASVNGRENDKFFYKWFINDNQINNHTDSYTPVEDDYQKMITVKIYDTNGDLVGVKNAFISKLPVVFIETEDRQPVVSKDKELNSSVSIQGNSEFNDANVLYSGAAKIKGRGNTTWNAAKKPYKLKLDSKADLFGMGKNKHWVLLSNPYDTSNMRNDIAYKLSGRMGMNYQDGVWVELILNGEDVGLYQLVEHVRIGSTRTDITDWEDIAESAAKAIYKKNKNEITKDQSEELIDLMTEDLSWTTSDVVIFNGVSYKVSDYYEIPSINGGYLLEITNTADNEYTYKTDKGMFVEFSKPECPSSDMRDSISGYFQAFEDALFADDYCTVYEGKSMRYTDFIDVESFAKGILINEIFQNGDFGYKSTYIYKEVDGKLCYGPVWDMDWAYNYSFESWTASSRKWIVRMLNDSVFMETMRDIYWQYRYNEIQNVIADGGAIDTAYNKICDAAIHNDKIWNNSVGFESNANDYKWRVQQKLKWLDSKLSSSTSKVYVQSLEVTSYPEDKVYNTGDTIKLSDYKITAKYSDGTSKTVNPDLVYSYVTDAIGIQMHCYNRITDVCGNAVIVFAFENQKVELSISRAGREDYRLVEKYINNIPTSSDEPSFVKKLAEAWEQYDALSESAKAQVNNYSILESAISEFNTMVDESDSAFIDCYPASCMFDNARESVVVVVKGSPERITVGSGTDSNNKMTFNKVGVRKLGNAEFWTINRNFSSSVKEYYFTAKYNLQYTEPITIPSSQLIVNEKKISEVICPDTVTVKEDCVIGFQTDASVSKIKITENEKTLVVTRKWNNGITLNFSTTGTHKIKIYYMSYNKWCEYSEVDIYVREPITTETMLYNSYCGEKLEADTNVRIVTSSEITSLSYSGNNTEIELEYKDQNGYRIWSGKLPSGAKYDICINGISSGGRVKTVSIDDVEIYYLNSAKLNPIISVDEGTEYTVSYHTSDSSVATVDSDGNIATHKTGYADITCTVTDEFGNTAEDTCTVTVYGKVKTVSIDDIEMYYQDSVKINPTIDIDDGTEYTVSYYTSDSSVVTVDNDGNITTHKQGSAQITCKVTDKLKNTAEDTCTVTVNGKIRDVSINDVSMNYKDSAKLNPTINIDDETNYTVKYDTSNSSVITVDDDGNIITHKKGSAQITCTVTDEFGNVAQDTCTVTVNFTFIQWIIWILLFGFLWY